MFDDHLVDEETDNDLLSDDAIKKLISVADDGCFFCEIEDLQYGTEED